MIRILLVFSLILVQYSLYAQDVIRLMNGKIIKAYKIEQDDSSQLIIYQKANGKFRDLEFDDIYSIKPEKKPKIIFYKPDSINKQLSVEEMHFYVLGESEARSNYKSTGFLIGGICVGAGSIVLMPAIGLSSGYSPLLATGIGAGGTFIPIKNIKTNTPEHLDNNHFVAGYKRVAKKKRNRNMFIGIGIGLAAGLTTGLITTL